MTPYKYYSIVVDLSSTDLFANSRIAGVTFFRNALPQGALTDIFFMFNMLPQWKVGT